MITLTREEAEELLHALLRHDALDETEEDAIELLRSRLALHDKESKANARLIIAAPDLLKVLQDVIACGYIKKMPEPSLLSKARAAIAKATGEEL